MYKVVMTHIKNEKEGREIRLEDIGKEEEKVLEFLNRSNVGTCEGYNKQYQI